MWYYIYTFIDICNKYSICPYIHSFICFFHAVHRRASSTCDRVTYPCCDLARSCDPTWSWGRWLGPLGTHCGPWMMKGNHHQMVRRPYFRWLGRFFSSGFLLVLANKHRDIKSTMWLWNGIGYTRIIQGLNWLMFFFYQSLLRWCLFYREIKEEDLGLLYYYYYHLFLKQIWVRKIWRAT